MPSPRPEKLFRRWAAAQGVERPFHILRRLEPDERRHIAEHLGIGFEEDAWDEAIEQASYDLDYEAKAPPIKTKHALLCEAEACLMIGMDGRGIQARSHSAVRKLNPFDKNYTWEEILQSITKEFKITCQDRSVAGMESAIFEHLADIALKKMPKDDLEGMEDLLRLEPDLLKRLLKAGFGPKAARLVMAGAAKATLRQGFGAYIHAVRVAAAMNRKLGTKLVMSSVSVGLKTALRALNVLLWAWLAADVLGFFFGSSRRRLLAVVAQIRSADLIDRMQ